MEGYRPAALLLPAGERSGEKRQPFAKNRANRQGDTMKAGLVAQAADHDVDSVQFRFALIGKQRGVQVNLAADLIAVTH